MSGKEIKVTNTTYSNYYKRIFDVILSSFAVICLSPLLMLVYILELHFHGKPAIYCTRRPGKDGKIFNMYKFRSMTNKRDKEGNLLPESERLTKLGLFLRRTSIDELPNLFNVLKGDMSIIGPRPLLIEYLPLYNERHAKRHAVRPGLACVRIIPSKSKTWTWGEQFENDIYYIENISLKTDIKMIFAVIKEAIKGADYRVNDTRVPFNGKNLYETRTKEELGINPVFNSINSNN
jgi:undecaprenyl phosphate N,N'-diacetylbacillosamine 1-phosphate transferase